MNSLGGKVNILRLMLPNTSTCVKNYDGVGEKKKNTNMDVNNIKMSQNTETKGYLNKEELL